MNIGSTQYEVVLVRSYRRSLIQDSQSTANKARTAQAAIGNDHI